MVLVAKVVSLFVLFAMTSIFGTIPYILDRCLKRKSSNNSKYKMYIGLMNCFAGGVFFGTAILHLFPEATEKIEEYIHFEYPIANALVGAGFMFILFIENVVGIFKGSHSDWHSHGHEHIPRNAQKRPGDEYQTNSYKQGNRLTFGDVKENKNVIESYNGQVRGQDGQSQNTEDTNGQTTHGSEPNTTAKDGIANSKVFVNHAMSPEMDISIVSRDSWLHKGEKSHNDPNREAKNVKNYGSVSIRESTFSENIVQPTQGASIGNKYGNNKEIEEDDPTNEHGVKFQIRSIILLLSISIHMIFEGLAVGLETNETDVWTLLGILSLHKCIVSFSIGLQLEESFKTLKKVLITINSFAIVTPVGVLIGIAISEYGGDTRTTEIIDGVLQSVATGTFFYVTFFEILQKEFLEGHNMFKVLCTVAGFAVTTGLRFLEHEE